MLIITDNEINAARADVVGFLAKRQHTTVPLGAVEDLAFLLARERINAVERYKRELITECAERALECAEPLDRSERDG